MCNPIVIVLCKPVCHQHTYMTIRETTHDTLDSRSTCTIEHCTFLRRNPNDAGVICVTRGSVTGCDVSYHAGEVCGVLRIIQ